MKDEIKEILDVVKLEINSTRSWIEPVGLNRDAWNKLLDYITNLQQEIEKLNDDKRSMLVQLYKANDEKDKIKQENERLKEELKYTIPDVQHNQIVTKLAKEKNDYKSRCEKVSEIIKKEKENMGYAKYDSCLLLIENILQNGSEKYDKFERAYLDDEFVGSDKE